MKRLHVSLNILIDTKVNDAHKKRVKIKGKEINMKKLKTIIALLLCLTMSVGAFACNTGGGDDGDITVLRMIVGDGGLGTQALEAQAARFAEKYANKSYADGKTGVILEVSANTGVSVNLNESLLSEGYHLIPSGDTYASLDAAVANGWVANIDSIIRSNTDGDNESILDKMPSSIAYKYRVSNPNSQNADKFDYYAVPSSNYYGGLSYDKDLFDQKSCYIASPDAEEPVETYSSPILGKDFTFTSVASDKSVGPNGIAGDEDDGMPSSLYELIALCEYLNNEVGVKPFILTGKYKDYINYFADALFASLLGYENATALNEFESDSLDVVVGFSEDDLFPGYSGAKKPITIPVAVDESCGYYTTHSVEKYYTYVFFQLMEEMGWYADSANSQKSHIEAQADFIFGIQANEKARQGAMLIECSYWFNESEIRGNFLGYKKTYREAPDRELRWMSLPVNVATSVTGTDAVVDTDICSYYKENTKGEPMTLSCATSGFVCVNARYADDPEIMEAIKDWLLFANSDAELSRKTVEGMAGTQLIYDVKDTDYANAKSFKKSFYKMTKNANIVWPHGDSDVYRKNASKFAKGGNSAYFATGGAYTTTVRETLKNGGLLKTFKDKILDISDWDEYFGSNAEVPTAAKYPAGHAKENQNVVFEG